MVEGGDEFTEGNFCRSVSLATYHRFEIKGGSFENGRQIGFLSFKKMLGLIFFSFAKPSILPPLPHCLAFSPLCHLPF